MVQSESVRQSQIYRGEVVHSRLAPVNHQFRYPVYFFKIRLSELTDLDSYVAGFGHNRRNLISLKDSEYLFRTPKTLDEKLSQLLKQEGYDSTFSAIDLVTFGQFLGMTFMPVSFFICRDAESQVALLIAEVHNTFGETHVYVCPNPDTSSRTLKCTFSKTFHVSPFFEDVGDYALTYAESDSNLTISLTLRQREAAVFVARLTGAGQPLTSANLAQTLARYPITGLLNFPRILWEAGKLYFPRRLPVFTRPVPPSPRTIRKLLPTRIEKLVMNRMFRALSTQALARLVITFPEGGTVTLGLPEAPEIVVHIHEYGMFSRLAQAMEIGFGQSYERGEWSSPDLPGLLAALLAMRADAHLPENAVTRWWQRRYLKAHRQNANTLWGSRKNITAHYDLSNAMYAQFLDDTLMYSSAVYQSETDTLSQAQYRKIDMLLEKAHLNPDCHLLEIGSGWGTLAIRAARNYGCRVTTTTISEAQYQLATARIADAGLSDQITVRLTDYRELTGTYDRIISCEMLEAVGKEFLPVFFKTCDRLLGPEGIAVIQTIAMPDQQYYSYSDQVDWIRLYIFPGGHLPSLTALTRILTRHTTLRIIDVADIGVHYARTLLEWRARWHHNRDAIQALGFDDAFIRRWDYYFSYCAAGFSQRYLSDFQLVLTRSQNPALIRHLPWQTVR